MVLIPFFSSLVLFISTREKQKFIAQKSTTGWYGWKAHPYTLLCLFKIYFHKWWSQWCLFLLNDRFFSCLLCFFVRENKIKDRNDFLNGPCPYICSRSNTPPPPVLTKILISSPYVPPFLPIPRCFPIVMSCYGVSLY